MSTVVIRYDGVDITSDVVYKESFFTMCVNGVPGQFSLKVKDVRWTKFFRAGKEVTVDVDGTRMFGGYSLTAGEVYAFPVDNTRSRQAPRFWVITGVDYNLLLSKRVLYDHANPANMNLRKWPAGSRIDTVINYVFDNYTDLAADGVSRAGVTDFGSPNPDQDGTIGTASIPFGQACSIANSLLNGVFYIDADKVFNFAEVDTPSSPYTLTDHPSGANEFGFREMTVVYDGQELVNDQLSWGVGQSQSPVFARVQDATSIGEHNRWQAGELISGIYKQASINKRANSIVYGNTQSKRGHKDDKKAWQVVTFQPIFKVGERVAVRSDVFGISDVVPIRRMTIRFPSRRKPRFELVLSHELDQPWLIYEFLFPHFGWDPPVIEVEGPRDPEKPEPELPGGFTAPEYEVTQYSLSDRDPGTSWEFVLFDHIGDAYAGQQHFHVRADGGTPQGIHEGYVLISEYLFAGVPGFGEGVWPHTSDLQNGARTYGRYLSFALPAGAYYARLRFDSTWAQHFSQKYSSGGNFVDPRRAYGEEPWPIQIRRGYWGTDQPTERPDAWGEVIGSTSGLTRIERRYGTPTYLYPYAWRDLNLAPGAFPFEVAMPISAGQEFIQFWLWYGAGHPTFSYPDASEFSEGIWVSPFLDGDISTNNGTPGYEAYAEYVPFENNARHFELTIYSRTAGSASGGRITVCHKGVALTVDRTGWGTPSPYVPGSTNVYFSGAAQRLGIDYTELDPALGLIEFMQPVPDTETVTVCYVPNGSF